MIAVVFSLLMALVNGGVSLFGPAGSAAAVSAASVPWWALGAVLGAFVAFFAGGIYVGAALALLALLAGFGLSDRPFWNFIGEMIWAPSTNFVLVSVPLFLLSGAADGVASVETGRAFFEAVGSKDKVYKAYPGMRHEPLNELGKEEVQGDISNWISAHL